VDLETSSKLVDTSVFWLPLHHRGDHPNIYRDRTEEWYYPQLESNKRARYLLGMNETAPPGETPSSLAYYGMGSAR